MTLELHCTVSANSMMMWSSDTCLTLTMIHILHLLWYISYSHYDTYLTLTMIHILHSQPKHMTLPCNSPEILQGDTVLRFCHQNLISTPPHIKFLLQLAVSPACIRALNYITASWYIGYSSVSTVHFLLLLRWDKNHNILSRFSNDNILY